MADTPYFSLHQHDQAELLHGLAPLVGRRAEILEKDIWLCHILSILFHLSCRKPMAFKGGSRHWYDMARLADHDVGKQAMYNRELLRDVLSIKEAFYRSRASHYDRCLNGQLRLVPEAPLLDSLRRDYQTMLGAQMLYGDIPSFDDIIRRLATLQDDINIHNTSIYKAYRTSFKS